MIGWLVVVASFSSQLTHAADDPTPCADLLGVESVRAFLGRTLGSRWDRSGQARLEDAVLVEHPRLPARERFVRAVMVSGLRRQDPMVVASNGRELEVVEAGEVGERAVLIDGGLRWVSSGKWIAVEGQSAEALRPLAAFLERNRSAAAELLSTHDVSSGELSAAEFIPFDWEGRAATAVLVSKGFGPKELYFTRDDQVWTADEVAREFTPHGTYLRLGGRLFYRRWDDEVVGSEIRSDDGLNFGLVDDFDPKRDKPTMGDSRVAALLGSVPHHFRKLLIAPGRKFGLRQLSQLRTVLATEEPRGRSFTVLILDEGTSSRIVSVIDEHSSHNYFRLQFMRPKRLRLEGGRVVTVRLDHGEWLTVPEASHQVDALLKSLGRGEIEPSR